MVLWDLEVVSSYPVPPFVPRLTSSSADFTVFLQHLGVASVNVGYSRKSTDPTYHYHSIYDSAYWMDTFGDPTFSRHVAVSKVLGLATMRLADSLILPLNVTGESLSRFLFPSSRLLI